MNTNDYDATPSTSVDIELPLVDQGCSAWGRLDAAQAYAETAFEGLGEAATPVLPASLADVAAHPSRLRMKWSGPVWAGQQRSLSAASAIRTGIVGLGELAACGQ